MLECVSRFMRGYPDSRDAPAMVVLLGKKERSLTGVIMVGQMPVNHVYRHIVHPGPVQDLSRGFSPGHPSGEALADVAIVRRGKLHLRINPQQKTGNREQKKQRVEYHLF